MPHHANSESITFCSQPAFELSNLYFQRLVQKIPELSLCINASTIRYCFGEYILIFFLIPSLFHEAGLGFELSSSTKRDDWQENNQFHVGIWSRNIRIKIRKLKLTNDSMHLLISHGLDKKTLYRSKKVQNWSTHDTQETYDWIPTGPWMDELYKTV